MKRLLLVIAALALVFGCVGNTPQEDSRELNVVVSILPQAEFVESVGGDKVDVTVMIPPGASPHIYEPTPSQLAKVAEADLYLKVGSGIEFEIAWMDDIEGVNPGMEVVDCSTGIPLIGMEEEDHHEEEIVGEEHHHEGDDPHIWNSPRNAKAMVQNIYEALAKADPGNAEYYRTNRDNYLSELDSVDSSITSTLQNATIREFIVYHPAWGYFAHEYGLRQVAVEEAGKEPTGQSLGHIIDEAKEHGITVIFASPQFSTGSAQTLADGIGGTVVLIDPLDKDYLENMRNVADAFAESMG